MTILRDISIVWSLLHTIIMFMLLFESRYSRKKTITLVTAAMVPLIIANLFVVIIWGTETYMQLILLICSLPSLIFFWILAKHRDGRFLFTFCMIDTIVLEIIYITNIIDYFLPENNYIFLFVSRLIIYPVLELLIYKKLRSIYLNVQNHTKKGWVTSAIIGFLFYVAITFFMSYPTVITKRLEYLPGFILLLILMPTIYIHILNTLRNQQRIHEITEQDNILKLQVMNMAQRMDEFQIADSKFRMERHNFRHLMTTIAGLIETENYDELRTLANEYIEIIRETQVTRYCSNAVIDSVLSAYIQKAKDKNITVNTQIALPDLLSVNELELATVFANAIENAIHGTEKLAVSKRNISIKILNVPCFMIQISNSFGGTALFDKNGIPATHHADHGFGTRSIVAFCEKHNAFYEFKTENNIFSLRIQFH